MQSSLFLVAAFLLTPLASCAPGEGVDGDYEGTYSLAIQDHIISSSDAVQLMQDKTGEPQYDQRLIAYYGKREPTYSPTWYHSRFVIIRREPFQSDVSHVLQLMDKLVNQSAPHQSRQTSPENTSSVLRSIAQVHL
jgi:hypothetical protein